MADKKSKDKAPPKAKAAAKAEPKAKAPAKAKAEPKPKREPMPSANGVTRPRPGGKCARVWDLADNETKRLKRNVSVAELMEAAKKDTTIVHSEANVKTEYARWRKFNGITGRVTAPKEPSAKTEKK